jgi:hypothetical protein
MDVGDANLTERTFILKKAHNDQVCRFFSLFKKESDILPLFTI